MSFLRTVQVSFLGASAVFVGITSFACNNQPRENDLILSEFTAGSLDVPAGKSCNDLDGETQSDCRTYALEIRNPNTTSADLQNYAIFLRLNSFEWGKSETNCSTPTGLSDSLNGIPAHFCDRLPLSGSLIGEGFLVITRDAYDPDLIFPRFVWNRFIFDGNDAIGLARSQNSYADAKCPSDTLAISFTPTGGSGAAEQWCIIDLFGEPTLPENSYSIAGASTDRTILDVFRRLPATSRGTTNWTGAAGTNASDSQWIVVTSTSTQRDYTNFGSLTPLTTTNANSVGN